MRLLIRRPQTVVPPVRPPSESIERLLDIFHSLLFYTLLSKHENTCNDTCVSWSMTNPSWNSPRPWCNRPSPCPCQRMARMAVTVGFGRPAVRPLPTRARSGRAGPGAWQVRGCASGGWHVACYSRDLPHAGISAIPSNRDPDPVKERAAILTPPVRARQDSFATPLINLGRFARRKPD